MKLPWIWFLKNFALENKLCIINKIYFLFFKFMNYYFFLLFLSLNLNFLNSFEYNDLIKPIECTGKGIRYFLLNSYNQPKYTIFMENCFIHIIDLITYAHLYCQNGIFIKQIFSLFSQKGKELKFVNPYALLYVLESLHNPLLEMIIIEKKNIKMILKKELEESLINDHEMLKASPELFLEKYSSKTSELIEEVILQNNMITESFIAFTETMLERILFDISSNAEDAFFIYDNLLSILHKYYESGFIDKITCNRLMWIIIHKFCYCVDLHMELTKKENIILLISILKKSKEEKKYYLEEIEPLIITKFDFLISHLNSKITST